MKLIHSKDGYDFYAGKNVEGVAIYNVVPTGDEPPFWGYRNSTMLDTLCESKGVKNIFKSNNYDGI